MRCSAASARLYPFEGLKIHWRSGWSRVCEDSHGTCHLLRWRRFKPLHTKCSMNHRSPAMALKPWRLGHEAAPLFRRCLVSFELLLASYQALAVFSSCLPVCSQISSQVRNKWLCVRSSASSAQQSRFLCSWIWSQRHASSPHFERPTRSRVSVSFGSIANQSSSHQSNWRCHPHS